MNSTTKTNRILVPIDYSQTSLRALPIAEQLASTPNVELHLLHVNQPEMAVANAGILVDAQTASPSVPSRQQLESNLNDIAVTVNVDADRVNSAITEGSPAEAISEYAKDHDIDMIIMTTHGHTGLTRLLMGSVAEKVVRTAPCPVLTLNGAGDA